MRKITLRAASLGLLLFAETLLTQGYQPPAPPTFCPLDQSDPTQYSPSCR
jgi:hypothetical protein